MKFNSHFTITQVMVWRDLQINFSLLRQKKQLLSMDRHRRYQLARMEAENVLFLRNAGCC